MRAVACLVVCVACSSSVPAPVKPARVRYVLACDGDWVNEAIASNQRAWLAPRQRGHRPVTVVDVSDAEVLVASVTPEVIVGRWVAPAAIGRAIVRETFAWSAPGVRDRGVRLWPGLPLSAEQGEWLRVPPGDDIELAGFVAAEDRGSIWTERVHVPTEERWRPRFHVPVIVRAKPEATAAIRATVPAGVGIEVVTHLDDWIEITVRAERAEVTGFIARPPPPPPRPPRPPPTPEEEAASEIEAEYNGPAPDVAEGTCLYDAPGGNTVGVVSRAFAGTIEPAARGWYRVRVAAAWGETAYYTTSPPLPPPPPPQPIDWSQWSSGDKWQ